MIKQCCVPLEQETAEKLIETTGKRSLKEALTEAVDFTLDRYGKQK